MSLFSQSDLLLDPQSARPCPFQFTSSSLILHALGVLCLLAQHGVCTPPALPTALP